MINFEKRISIEQVEEGTELAPKFDSNGLIPVVTTDYASGEVLMQGYMNEEALTKTIELGEAFIIHEAEKHCGIKVKPVALFKQLKKFVLMMTKIAFGCC